MNPPSTAGQALKFEPRISRRSTNSNGYEDRAAPLWSRGARPTLGRGILHFLLHWAWVHQHGPPRAELKKMRPQAGGCFDKSGARRARRRPRAGALPGTRHERRGVWKFDDRLWGHTNRRRNSFRVPLRNQRAFLPIAHGSPLIFVWPWLCGQNGDHPVSLRCARRWGEVRMSEYGLRTNN
jgi:hypothetical protein